MKNRARAKRRYLLLVLTSLLLVSVGCSMRTADLTAMSTKIVQLEKIDLDALEATNASGDSYGVNILGIPISWPHLEDAVDEALANGNGDFLTDAVVHDSHYSFLIGGIHKINVEGSVVKTRGSLSKETSTR